jgi:hypothetical protein
VCIIMGSIVASVFGFNVRFPYSLFGRCGVIHGFLNASCQRTVLLFAHVSCFWTGSLCSVKMRGRGLVKPYICSRDAARDAYVQAFKFRDWRPLAYEPPRNAYGINFHNPSCTPCPVRLIFHLKSGLCL